MKIFIGLAGILIGFLVGIFAQDQLTAYFGGNKKEAKLYEQLLIEGKMTYAVLDSNIEVTNFKLLELYEVQYYFEVENKVYNGRYFVTNKDSIPNKVVPVYYLEHNPQINEVDVKAKFAEASAKVGTQESIDFGKGFDKTLEAVVSGDNNTYQWYKNNSLITGATNKNYVITDATQQDAGTYFCRVKNSVVTSLTIETERVTLVYDATFSTEDKEFSKAIKLYPNPVNDVLQISNTTDISIDRIEIYNVLGARVQVIKKPQNTINVSSLSNGMYLLKLYTEKGSTTKRIVKN